MPDDYTIGDLARQDIYPDDAYAGLGGDPRHLAASVKNWWMNQPSWFQKAQGAAQKDVANYQTGGIGGLLADTQDAQDLAGGFGGVTKSVGGPLSHQISAIKLPKPVGEYTATYRPSGTVVQPEIEPAALEGKLGYPTVTDTTRGAQTLTGLGRYKLPEPVPMQAGPQFPAVKENQPYVWMADQGNMSRMANKVGDLAEQSGRDVVVVPSALSPAGADYSHHIWNPLTQKLGDTRGISNEGAAWLNERMRNIDPDFPGVRADTNRLLKYFDNAPRDIRTTFVQSMDTRQAQDFGFPDVAEVRAAAIHPDLLNAPLGSSGFSTFRLDPQGGVVPADIHGTYTHAGTGTNVGSLGVIAPPELMFPGPMASLRQMAAESGKALNKYIGRPDYYFQGRIPEKTPSGYPLEQAQLFDPQWVDRMSRYKEQFKKVGGAAALGAGMTLAQIAKAEDAPGDLARQDIYPDETKMQPPPSIPASTGEEYAGLGGDPRALASGIRNWWMNQPSWQQKAGDVTARDTAAYQSGGAPAVIGQLADTSAEQDLAGGFGGNIKGVKVPVVPGALAAMTDYHPPFYSAVERAVQDAKQNTAPGQQWAGYLRNQPGVKPEEVETLGLGKLFEQPTVSKDALLGEIAANKVNVGEVVKGDAVPTEFGTDVRPKFSQYTLPGGENYREMLLTLPQKNADRLAQINDEMNRIAQRPAAEHEATDEIAKQWDRLNQERKLLEAKDEGPPFQSSHYDEPNILAHVRYNDRVIDGKKTLFVEEVQSDWHQAGKRKGYSEPMPQKVTAYYTARGQDIPIGYGATEGEALANSGDWRNILRGRDIQYKTESGGMSPGVPDAPFKTTWPDLAMKRVIREAAEKGYDKVAWTPGSVQADRYDLSKHIDHVSFNHNPTNKEPGKIYVAAHPVGGGHPVIQGNFTPQEIEANLGKDIADQIVNGKNTYGAIQGEGLKVGGEGMKGFYDEILPATVNKLVKKHGARVTQGEIKTQNTGVDAAHYTRDPETGSWHPPDTTQQVHTLDITPSLRAAAMKGFPLFAAGGIAATGAMGELAKQDQYK